MNFFEMETVVQATKSKSLSFFCTHNVVEIGQDAINDLKKISSNNGNQNVRICLHDSPDSSFHDMIILQCPGHYYRPHKHMKKVETIHLIEGDLKVFVLMIREKF